MHTRGPRKKKGRQTTDMNMTKKKWSQRQGTKQELTLPLGLHQGHDVLHDLAPDVEQSLLLLAAPAVPASASPIPGGPPVDRVRPPPAPLLMVEWYKNGPSWPCTSSNHPQFPETVVPALPSSSELESSPADAFDEVRRSWMV